MRMLRSAKANAKVREIPFELTVADIPEIPDVCPVLGIPLFRTNGVQTMNTPSLDRINPSHGYVRGNVRVISLRANILRSNATVEELRLILKDLINSATS
jgi:hypothetical protein